MADGVGRRSAAVRWKRIPALLQGKTRSRSWKIKTNFLCENVAKLPVFEFNVFQQQGQHQYSIVGPTQICKKKNEC